MPFVSLKPQAALWRCKKQLLTSCFGLCALAEHGPRRFVACTNTVCVFIYLCVFILIYAHACKKNDLCLLFLPLPFLRNAGQTWSDSQVLICIFLLGSWRKTLSDSWVKARVVFACLDDIRFLKAGLPGCVLYQQIRRKAEEFLCPFLQQNTVQSTGL